KNPNQFRDIDLETRLKLARGSIRYHTFNVSGIAFGLGMPGLLALPFTVPMDLAQFYFHTLVLMQKLLYLMGWPDLNLKDASVDDETLTYMKLFLGAMHGIHAARATISVLSRRVADQVAKRLPHIPLTKHFAYNLTKAIAKWLGVKITKPIFARIVGRMIPVLGGVISSSITHAVFSSMSYNFLFYLSGLGVAKLQSGVLSIEDDELVDIETEIENEIIILDNELRKK
ncbi:MAG: hypothetical protein U1C33_05215, partial [Candidatus Cloacimonadaceae bacterium]|nr:hypothetical protein [Candidatus Cloacimonadaceae bacterium]